jgi:hypothetical protein
VPVDKTIATYKQDGGLKLRKRDLVMCWIFKQALKVYEFYTVYDFFTVGLMLIIKRLRAVFHLPV